MSDRVKQIREAAEADLLTFIKLVAPQRVLGGIHEDVIRWWTREDAKSHQLLLLPRAHQKSMLIAFRVAWWITKNPETTIMYVSSKFDLAEQQLGAVKDILVSDIYRRYWPEMVNADKGKREEWTAESIKVDHPKRKQEGVRDPTVFIASLTAGKTGFHCDVAVFDDFVDVDNAYTEGNRQKVRLRYSLLASVENPEAVEWVVGTRYHPKDLYSNMLTMSEDEENESGDIEESALFEIMEEQIESEGDGTGEFIWPRQQRKDGKWFGFNQQVWKKKFTQYLDKTQFYAQYYNNPNDESNAPIERDSWEYYDKKHLRQSGGQWYFKDSKLNIAAAVDFAFSRAKKADYTAVAVVGVDSENRYFILDLHRFKTDKIADYFSAIEAAWNKWQFRKIRLEVTAAQQATVTELKERMRREGMLVSVDEYRPTRHEGNKFERLQSILEPRYSNGQMHHYRGGNCQILEEELVMANPPHDDVKDATAAAIDLVKPPKVRRGRTSENKTGVTFNSRWGGIQR